MNELQALGTLTAGIGAFLTAIVSIIDQREKRRERLEAERRRQLEVERQRRLEAEREERRYRAEQERERRRQELEQARNEEQRRTELLLQLKEDLAKAQQAPKIEPATVAEMQRVIAAMESARRRAGEEREGSVVYSARGPSWPRPPVQVGGPTINPGPPLPPPEAAERSRMRGRAVLRLAGALILLIGLALLLVGLLA